MGAVFTRRVVAMKRSRTEVGRWRMLRQVNRRKARWLEAQSRRNMRILAIRKGLVKRQLSEQANGTVRGAVVVFLSALNSRCTSP